MKPVRILAVILALVVSFGLCAASFAQSERTLPSGASYADIGNDIEAYVKKHEATTAAMEVAVFDAQSTIYRNAFGYADIEQKRKADFDTVFEWGSVTKLLVWVSVMQLWEQDKLDLEADITTYLPDTFVQKLKITQPVTMVQLMNHNAGFQEMIADLMIRNRNHVYSLEETLLQHPPVQIYEPGTVTAYSNWGTSLAAYIVECISGQSFSDYVHEHIFAPLGMKRTALLPDLSDREWVKEQRTQLQGYTADRKRIGRNFYHIPLYPSGMGTGTLEDFTTFAKALLPSEHRPSPLFQSESTLRELLSPTSHFAQSGVAQSSHGFWTTMYKIPVLGHGGNTITNSSMLLIDPASGTGIVVMTNQSEETIYNSDMPELIFGRYVDSDYYDNDRPLPYGPFRTARTIRRGPMSILSAGITPIDEEEKEEFWTYGEQNGIIKMSYPYADHLPVEAGEATTIQFLLGSLIAGAVYAIITLLGSAIRTKKRAAKNETTRTESLTQWNRLACGLILLSLLNLLLYALQVYAFSLSAYYRWHLVLFAVLAAAMVAMLLYLLRNRRWIGSRKRYVFRHLFTGLFLLTSLLSILYWNLYQFWAL